MSESLYLWKLGIHKGKYDERERIIELLEQYANAECTEWCSAGCDCYGKHESAHFIALIKGEN